MSRRKTEEDYYDSVKVMAEESVEWADNEEELDESVWEVVDSSQFVMYTDNNLDALKYSRKDPGELTRSAISAGQDWRDVLQAMAFDVLRKDVWDEVNRIRKKKEKDLEKIK